MSQFDKLHNVTNEVFDILPEILDKRGATGVNEQFLNNFGLDPNKRLLP